VSGVVQQVRDLMPLRALTLVERYGVAERQALRLLQLSGITQPPVPEQIITQLPRIQVERITLLDTATAGVTEWAHGRWLIMINAGGVKGRQRFSLAHEFKHVLDSPFLGLIYPATDVLSSKQQAEPICDHFASCLLMPRAWVKRRFGQGQQNSRNLAAEFDVSLQAMQFRLVQLGLIQPARRCGLVA
jgi:Zn-dependent peptidase ImmA (M78 family)